MHLNLYNSPLTIQAGQALNLETWDGMNTSCTHYELGTHEHHYHPLLYILKQNNKQNKLSTKVLWGEKEKIMPHMLC